MAQSALCSHSGSFFHLRFADLVVFCVEIQLLKESTNVFFGTDQSSGKEGLVLLDEFLE